MKKIVYLLIFTLILSSCNESKIKSLKFKGEVYGDIKSVLQNAVVINDISKQYPEVYTTKMDLYSIKPINFTKSDFEQFFDLCKIKGEVIEKSDGVICIKYDDFYTSRMFSSQGQIYIEKNHFVYNRGYSSTSVIKKSEQELKQKADEIVNNIPFLEGNYVYSYTNTQSEIIELPNGEIKNIPVKMMLSYRRELNGFRIVGEDQLHIYFDAEGFCGLSISYFNYEKYDEVDIITTSQAVNNIKKASTFDVDTRKVDFVGVLPKITANEVYLDYVNQYSNGVEILQPLYVLHGLIEENDNKSTFTATVKAIPDKYLKD